MRSFLLALILPLFFFHLPKAFADEPAAQNYVVSGNEKFTTSSHPTLLSGLTVPAGTSLKIEAGIKLTFTAGANFLVQGKLIIGGTQKEPVILQGQDGATWNGIYSTNNQGSYQWLTILNAQNPLIAAADGVSFQHITFEDNIQNTLVLGQLGYNHAVELVLDSLTFRNRLLGSAMGNEGVIVQGNFADVTFQNSFFDDERTAVNGVFGFYVGGTAITASQKNITHKRGCVFGMSVTKNNVPWNLTFNPQSCDPQTVPIVFVPGYGTSINLAQLVQPKPANPILTGWRFFQAVTPSYTSFIQTVTQNKIPVTTAYYDWRLPAEKIVDLYLLPAIQAAKAATGSSVVNLVAHSYGGLVARQYIQSNKYQGDVVSLTEIGTPNLGAAKAYQVWEGGQVPSDWQAINGLINWYKEDGNQDLNNQEIIQKYFPSAEEIFPYYPAVSRTSPNLLAPSDLYYKNDLAANLLSTQNLLLQRVTVRTVTSQSQPTLTTINVSPAQASRLWRDGLPLSTQPPLGVGDGTVPLQSSMLTNTNVQNISVNGTHPDLPSLAAISILRALYPGLQVQPAATAPFERSSRDMLWFFFDCPVEVKITLPDGTSRSSADPDQGDDHSFTDQVGNVAVTPEMTWVVVPSLEGQYQVEIKALQDTPVRAWVNDQAPVNFTLKAQEIVDWYPFAPQASPLPSPSPSAQISSSTLPPQNQISPLNNPQILTNLKLFSFSKIIFFPIVNVVVPTLAFNQAFQKYTAPTPAHQKDYTAMTVLVIFLAFLLYLHLRRRHPP